MEATRAAVVCILAQLLTASIAILQVDLLSSCPDTSLVNDTRDSSGKVLDTVQTGVKRKPELALTLHQRCSQSTCKT